LLSSALMGVALVAWMETSHEAPAGASLVRV
jgi:hypothetical protein